MGFPPVPLWLVSALRRPGGQAWPGILRYEPVIAGHDPIRTSLRYPDKSASPFRVTPHRPTSMRYSQTIRRPGVTCAAPRSVAPAYTGESLPVPTVIAPSSSYVEQRA